MSAPLAGKFQDHYAVLGVEPAAEPKAIQQAYTRLAHEYHPDNPATGDEQKFDAVNLAYEVLSQPDLRAEFDKLKGLNKESMPQFSGLAFFKTLGWEAGLRSALLCVLYDRRRQKPFQPSLSVRHVENIIGATLEEMTFVLWYLKEHGWVVSDDKSSLQITCSGVDYLEQHPPSPDQVMPHIKPGGLATPPDSAAEAAADAALEETVYEETVSEESEYAEEEAVPANTTPTAKDPQRRANLNRILSRGGA